MKKHKLKSEFEGRYELHCKECNIFHYFYGKKPALVCSVCGSHNVTIISIDI